MTQSLIRAVFQGVTVGLLASNQYCTMKLYQSTQDLANDRFVATAETNKLVYESVMKKLTQIDEKIETLM